MERVEKYMEESIKDEPVRKIKIGSCDVTILGTAHISKKSADAVSSYIKNEKPDTVCIELCQSRLDAMKDPDRWKKLDIFKVFKEKKMYLLLANLILSSFQKKLGKGDVNPGDEMRAGINEGEASGAKVVPVDREVQTTLKRAWGKVGFFSKMYLISALMASLLVREDVDASKIEEMKSDDALKDLFSQLPARYNEIKKIIIDERDIYLAEKIRRAAADSKKLFAVVGAGHLEGIMKYITQENEIESLDIIPEKTFFEKVSFMFLPLLILGLIAYTFYAGGEKEGMDYLKYIIVIKGGLAALGAVLALAHPLSILMALVMAPIGTFIPVFKPGWMSALCESYLRKPLVEDFERIGDDSEHFTGFWKNRVIRIFLVLLLPQTGSSIGTFLVTWKGISSIF